MDYLYERAPNNFEDLASGRVLYHVRGTTSFPVRLASEVIQRCFQLLGEKGDDGPYTVYDPCCGSAYLLTIIGLLHGRKIRKMFASDVNADVLQAAGSNLSLLTADGMHKRKEQLEHYLRQYNKASHREALTSVARLTELLKPSSICETHVFQRDMTLSPDWTLGADCHGAERPPLNTLTAADQGAHQESRVNANHYNCQHVQIVITDLPYGEMTSWNGDKDEALARFFDQLYSDLMPARSVAAIIADKGQKLKHDRFNRVQYFKIGKRQVALFEPI